MTARAIDPHYVLEPTNITAGQLLDAARFASSKAFCPHSNFPVGAAVLTPTGDIFTGANIEVSGSIVYCAEQVAIINAISYLRSNHHTVGEGSIIAIATHIGRYVGSDFCRYSCGKCLQVMERFMHQDSVVLISGIGELTLRDLLPYPHKR